MTTEISSQDASDKDKSDKEKSDKDKKDHQPPKGATHKVAWASDTGHAAEIEVIAEWILLRKEIEVIAEWILLRKKERPAAEIFYTYYRMAGASGEIWRRRPVSFIFNGGPGASSAYLHVGGLSPRRVLFKTDGNLEPPPVRIVNNPESWIAFSDLVFVDPVGTGFSRIVEPDKKPDDKEKPDPAKTVEEKEFYALNRDLESLGEFIERFLSKYKLWDAPVAIIGESYGGFRTAKLARRLQETHGVGLSTAIAISPALEWSLLNENDYDVLRSMDCFCTMALAATITGVDPFPDREYHAAPDPTFSGIDRIFTSAINHVLRAEIGVESERRYELISMAVNSAWKTDSQHAFEGPAGATDDLRYAMSMNPDMKVLIAHGYYDMVTPYFSSERLVEQMKLLPQQRDKLFIRHFGGGHMFYTWEESRRAFRDWALALYA
jgi:carboxypeptidase C (cathepsin A)